MAGQIKVDSINADSNLALKIANTAVAFIDATGLRPTSGNVNLDATATSKLYLPSANTVAIQTAGVTAVTVDSSQNVTLAGTLTTTGITNSGVATGARFNPTGSSVTGNGMYLPAANSLGLSTNGTNAVYIDSSQNVGIGTASPAAKFHSAGGVIATGSASAFTATAAIMDVSAGVARFNATGADNSTNGTMTFNTASANAGVFNERMRINSSGDFLVGTTSPLNTGSNRGNATFNGGSGGHIMNFASSGTFKAYFFQDGTNWSFYNGVNGGNIDISAYTAGVRLSSGGTSWSSLSDERQKDIIEPIENAVAKVVTLRAVIGKYKTDEEGTRRSFLIAQDVQAVLPEAVDAQDSEKLSLRYTEIIPLLVKAIQELKAINDTQAATITALTARIVALETI